MPIYNEALHLTASLESIERQTFPHELLLFVAVDGDSNDGSRDIVRAWLSRSGIAGRILSNPLRKIPVALNLGLGEATDDDIIVRLDAHTIYGDTYVSDAVAALENLPNDVACVGSAYRPAPGNSFEERVVAALYTNPMGLGGADFRFGNDIREVDLVYLGAWRPGVLALVGGFNESMRANEDGEVSARLRKCGYRIMRVPLPCEVVVKRGILGSIQQWSRYGYWRAKMLQRNLSFIRVRHILSPAATLIVVCLVCSPIRLTLIPLAGIYTALVFHKRSREESALVTLAACLFFAALQFGFGLGMLAGALSPPLKRSPAYGIGASQKNALVTERTPSSRKQTLLDSCDSRQS